MPIGSMQLVMDTFKKSVTREITEHVKERAKHSRDLSEGPRLLKSAQKTINEFFDIATPDSLSKAMGLSDSSQLSEKVHSQPHIEKLTNQFEKELSIMMDHDSIAGEIARTFDIPLRDLSDDSGELDLDSFAGVKTAEKEEDYYELYQDAASYSKAHGLDQEQTVAMLAGARLGGKNALRLTENKEALREMFHALHQKIKDNPEIKKSLADRFKLDPEGNPFIDLTYGKKEDRDKLEAEDKIRLEKEQQEEQQDDILDFISPSKNEKDPAKDSQKKDSPSSFDDLLGFDNSEMEKKKEAEKPKNKLPKRDDKQNKKFEKPKLDPEVEKKKKSAADKSQPKPKIGPDPAEEAMFALWGAGRVPNSAGRPLLTGFGSHISKRHEELGNGVVKMFSRDVTERNQDWLNSSSLPSFGNKLNEDLNLQKPQPQQMQMEEPEMSQRSSAFAPKPPDVQKQQDKNKEK